MMCLWADRMLVMRYVCGRWELGLGLWPLGREDGLGREFGEGRGELGFGRSELVGLERGVGGVGFLCLEFPCPSFPVRLSQAVVFARVLKSVRYAFVRRQRRCLHHGGLCHPRHWR